MKRDMDLARKILLEIESWSYDKFADIPVIEGYSQEEVGFHSYLLKEAGLIDGIDRRVDQLPVPCTIPRRLTWNGYEFLEASRDPARWEKAKGIASKLGGATLSIFIQILTAMMTEQVKKLMP